MTSKFLLCKHLTYELSFPQYRDVIRSRSPPFLQIKRRENCFRAIFAGEDKVSTFSPVLTGHLRPTIGEILISPDPRHITGFFPSHQGADGVESMRAKATEMKRILQWGIDHVEDLSIDASGMQQINHLYSNVLFRYQNYHRLVTQNVRSRSAPITWKNSDVLYLP